MTNDELIRIYEQALEDWEDLQEKFDSIEDKTIENINIVFADQCEEQAVFFTIKHGCIESYVSNGSLEEPFSIIFKDRVQPYIYVDDIKKRIESLS